MTPHIVVAEMAVHQIHPIVIEQLAHHRELIAAPRSRAIAPVDSNPCFRIAHDYTTPLASAEGTVIDLNNQYREIYCQLLQC